LPQEPFRSKKKHCQPQENYEAIYQEICQEIGKNSILLRTIFQACFLGVIQVEEGPAIVSVNAPNRYYQQVIDSRLKQRITQLLEDKIQRKIDLKIVNRGPEISD